MSDDPEIPDRPIPALMRAALERRTTDGRRRDDEARAIVALRVAREFRRTRRRWIAAWLLTLAASAGSWAYAEHFRRDADRGIRELIRQNRALVEDADRKARIACERTRTFGLPLARAYRRYKILSPAQLEAYVATIPTRC